VEPGKVPGWDWILDQWFAELRRLAGGRDGGDVPGLVLRDVIEQVITSLRRRWSLHGSFAEALRQFARARANGDEEQVRELTDWFMARPGTSAAMRARLREAGIREPISRRNAKEMLRALSVFMRYRGFGGMLILLDEVENVILQTQTARRTAYTILRELIDNVDDRHGMTRTAFYVSGTPDLFEGEKGIAEYEALASRVLLPGGQRANPAAPVIDLSAFPLTPEDLLEMARSIAGLHAIAHDWRLPADIDARLRPLQEARGKGAMPVRPWVRAVVDALDEIRRSAS
jgi:hypothetical protein